MSWSVVISPGTVSDPGAFTVSAAMKFDLQGRVHDNEFGQVQFTEYFVDVEGDIVVSPASQVAINLLATMDQLKVYQPRNVYLVQDGVTRYTWTTQTCIGSPRVLAFRTVEEDGNADSHWRYGFTIYAKQLGNLGNGVLELQTSLLVVSEQSQVVKKVWRAYAKATNVAAALGKVMGFKPSDKTLHEEIERFFQDNSVRASWTWDLYKNFYITEEPIVFTGMGKSYVWDYAVGDGANPPPPIIHRAANEIIRIKVRGVVRGTDPKLLNNPPLHFQENGTTMVHAAAEEQTYFPGIEDPIRGVWALPYEEVWLFTGPNFPPAPNHSNHQNPSYISPGDGPIG